MSVWKFAIITALLVSPAVAQQQQQQPAPSPPAASNNQTLSDPNLKIGTVSMADGIRVSNIIGSAVYNDHGEKIGSIDDLMTKQDHQIVEAIISVGGFLGVGSKLVAVQYDQLTIDMNQKDGQHVILPDATKDKLASMTSFTYH